MGCATCQPLRPLYVTFLVSHDAQLKGRSDFLIRGGGGFGQLNCLFEFGPCFGKLSCRAGEHSTLVEDLGLALGITEGQIQGVRKVELRPGFT